MPWSRARKSELASTNPFVRKGYVPNTNSSELAPDHISRTQIRTVRKPVSEASLAEIKAITEEKVEQPIKTTTYEQMVKRAKNPTRIPSGPSTPVPPAKAVQTQSQFSNDQLRGAQAKKTRIDQGHPPLETPQDLHKAPASTPETKSKSLADIPLVTQTNTATPSVAQANVTHSSKDTPVASLPRKEKPSQDLSKDVPQKKLWPAPLSPMVPKPAIHQEKSQPVVPQPFQPSGEDTLPLKPQAVTGTQSRAIKNASGDPFERFSKDKKDDTLF